MTLTEKIESLKGRMLSLPMNSDRRVKLAARLQELRTKQLRTEIRALKRMRSDVKPEAASETQKPASLFLAAHNAGEGLPSSDAAEGEAGTIHDSDCATCNEPAFPAGPCDCRLSNTSGAEASSRLKRSREGLLHPPPGCHRPMTEDCDECGAAIGETYRT